MGKKISFKAARLVANLTQTEIAKKMGVTSRTVINWEKGTSIPNIQQFKKWCEVCGLTTDDVII